MLLLFPSSPTLFRLSLVVSPSALPLPRIPSLIRLHFRRDCSYTAIIALFDDGRRVVGIRETARGAKEGGEHKIYDPNCVLNNVYATKTP